ncbi:NDR1/HIN1-like protein 6 [Argentina anserina]|uniref:NDR1/HIN1-like protein 6 n=1 Tax=Argentina anserina TaxID=57926 RepID=UPI0021761D75|nr:NDR1/HIN1-like protein 6 [Potentilla anserina]
MADHQRVHPVPDVGAVQPHAPEAPLVPRGAAKSDNGDSTGRDMEAGRYYSPFQGRSIPMNHSTPPKKRSCLRKCLCWTICLLLLQVIVVAITGGIIYLVFRPKLPKYTVSKLQITQFDLNADQSLNATFDVSITARNPNKKIGIYYEGGSRINVWYTSTKLCEGGLPKFYQGHRNTTELVVPLSGQTQDASSLFTTLQQQQQQTGNVPLTLRVRQPVRIKLGSLKLPKIKFVVRCRLLVDTVSENNDINIQSSSCKFRLRL